MRKTVSALLCCLLLWTLLPLNALALGGNPVCRSVQKLTVDGAAVEAEAYNIGGNNFYKLRDIAWLLKDTAARFDVGWDPAQKLVTVTTRHNYTAPDGHELESRPDYSDRARRTTQRITINGGARDDLTVFNIGDSNFFKLRDLGTALGFGVDYDEPTNTVAITTPASVEPVEFNDFLFLGDSLISNPHWNANLWGRHGHKAFAGGGAVISQFFGCTQYQVFVGAKSMGMQGTLRGRTPKGICILLGANDLGLQEAAVVEANYMKLLDELRGAFDPSVPIFVLAVYPVNMDFQNYYGLTSVRNERTRTFNTTLANVVLSIDGVWFADGTGPLTDADGMLASNSGDGLHISPLDYDRFYDGIAEALYATGVVVKAGGS